MQASAAKMSEISESDWLEQLAATDEMQTYEIEIANYNSAGIQSLAAEIGATHMRQIATGMLDSASANLFAIPTTVGEIRVIDTNAEPVWEEDDSQAFAATLKAYGLIEDAS